MTIFFSGRHSFIRVYSVIIIFYIQGITSEEKLREFAQTIAKARNSEKSSHGEFK